MKWFGRLVYLIVFLLVSFSSHVEAHKLQPAYLEINEHTAGTFNILWKRPLVGNMPMNIYPQLPEKCSNITEPSINPSQSFALERWLVDCGENGLTNETIVIDGLSATQTDTLLRIELADGSMHTTLLRPDSPSFVVPEKPSKTKVA